jgi:hypothetical protein
MIRPPLKFELMPTNSTLMAQPESKGGQHERSGL